MYRHVTSLAREIPRSACRRRSSSISRDNRQTDATPLLFPFQRARRPPGGGVRALTERQQGSSRNIPILPQDHHVLGANLAALSCGRRLHE